MRFAFIAKHRHIWPVSWMCEVLDVSRSGFHAWLTRPASKRARHDARLVTSIDKSFKDSDRTYGARRIWRDVLEDGLVCGLHRVETKCPRSREQAIMPSSGRKSTYPDCPDSPSQLSTHLPQNRWLRPTRSMPS